MSKKSLSKRPNITETSYNDGIIKQEVSDYEI